MAHEPLRLMLFDERPDCLVVYAPDGAGTVQLPPLPYPFTKQQIDAAMREADQEYRLTIGTPGQWTKSRSILKNAARAERSQRASLERAVQKAQARGATSLHAASRAEALARKQVVDGSLRELKDKLGRAKAEAYTHGSYLPVSEYRDLERGVEELKQESQALQVRIAELRHQEHEEHEAEWQRQAPARRAYAEGFLAVASDVLPEDMLQRIHGLMADADSDNEGTGRASGPPECPGTGGAR
jgi:hypothetical protein